MVIWEPSRLPSVVAYAFGTLLSYAWPLSTVHYITCKSLPVCSNCCRMDKYILPQVDDFLSTFMVTGAVICLFSAALVPCDLCALFPPSLLLLLLNLTNTLLIFFHLSSTNLTLTDASQSHISKPYMHCALLRSFERSFRSPCNFP
jgi:hypothetical protein